MLRVPVACAWMLLAAALPLAPTVTACEPVADGTVETVPTPTTTYYLKTRDHMVRPAVEAPLPDRLWEETNHMPGLQPNAEMACGGPADLERLDVDLT